MVTKSYTHLNYEDRKSIERYLKEGLSVIKIAEKLNVHRSTIYNEIKRAGVSTENKDAYSADVAQHAM